MSDGEIRQYLLIRDVRAGQLLREPEDFGTDSESALAAYETAEARYRGRPEIDVVLLGSDSLETLRLTHANYFATYPHDVDEAFAEIRGHLHAVGVAHPA